MKGDFTRNTFDPMKQFTRVLMQQGRVQLDADWNEQVAILLHYLQTLAADLIGPFGGPEKLIGSDGVALDNHGFEITVTDVGNPMIADLKIGHGRYYVDGILCENPARDSKQEIKYSSQVNYPLEPNENNLPDLPFLVYLDVWEQLVTSVEDDSIREVALGGPDTAARAQVVWQVKTEKMDTNSVTDLLGTDRVRRQNAWKTLVQKWQPENRGQLKARTKDPGAQSDEACITPPDARYRGAENQLYRVEIHNSGMAANNRTEPSATFKWSRDNGSVVFPIRSLTSTKVIVEHLGRDARFSLQEGDWVEIVDDISSLHGEAGKLVKVEAIDRVEMTVTLDSNPGYTYPEERETHPLLRRWDGVGEIEIKEAGGAEETWLSLEDGIEIQFQTLENGEDEKHTYRTGDYWLIPARTATGDVEWPKVWDNQELVAAAITPHGVIHHFAPLAIVDAEGEVTDLRYLFQPAGKPVPPGS